MRLILSIWNRSLLVVLIAAVSTSIVPEAAGSTSVELVPTDNHHIAQLNSDDPYVAGYCVATEDFNTYEMVDALAVTVSFPSTDPRFFPSDNWIGGGMFMQAQDHRFRNIDYAFYMMVVVDSLGNLFIDLGLHQTREGTLPIQMPTEELIFAYTWAVLGMNWTVPLTLQASWDQDGSVHYSVSAVEFGAKLASVNIPEQSGCENIMYNFYSGNVIIEPFPFSRYVNFFQFGIVSSESIADNHWAVDLREPRILKKSTWVPVSEAWSIQGDVSFLDKDWKWGGVPYLGVSAKYYHNSLDNPGEVVFFYDGHTLSPGEVLWDTNEQNTINLTSGQSQPSVQFVGAIPTIHCTTQIAVLALVILVKLKSAMLRKHATA